MRVILRGIMLVAVSALTFAVSDSVCADATYTYDELGRITTVTYADGAQVIYTYDPADNRTQQQKFLASSNQPPVAGNDSISVGVGQSLTFDPLVNDSDPEAQMLTIIGLTATSEGDATIINNRTQLNYQSTGVSAGTDTFDYYVQDPSGGIAKGTVDVTVTMSSNQPPDAVDDGSYLWGSGSTYYIDPRVNDSDPEGDALEIISVTNGSGVSTQIFNNGTQIQVTTVPLMFGDPDVSGSFTYTISDGNGGTDSATVSYTVKSPPKEW